MSGFAQLPRSFDLGQWGRYDQRICLLKLEIPDFSSSFWYLGTLNMPGNVGLSITSHTIWLASILFGLSFTKKYIFIILSFTIFHYFLWPLKNKIVTSILALFFHSFGHWHNRWKMPWAACLWPNKAEKKLSEKEKPHWYDCGGKQLHNIFQY